MAQYEHLRLARLPERRKRPGFGKAMPNDAVLCSDAVLFDREDEPRA